MRACTPKIGRIARALAYQIQVSHPHHPLRAWLNMHWMVIVVGFTAILGRLIESPATTLVIWRTGLAAALIFLFVRRPGKPGSRYRLAALGTGVILGLHWLTFFGSIKLANVSICSAGIATAALMISLIEAISERRAPRLSEVVLGLVVIPAILLIVGVEPGFRLGLGVAVVSAFLAALFSVINKGLVRAGTSALTLTAWEVTGACATCLLASPLLLDEPTQLLPQGLDWLWIGLLATVCTVYSFALQIHLLKEFSAFEFGLAINLEPIYAIALAALIFQEHEGLSSWFFLGAALIVAANFAKPVIRRWRGRKSRFP